MATSLARTQSRIKRKWKNEKSYSIMVLVGGSTFCCCCCFVLFCFNLFHLLFLHSSSSFASPPYNCPHKYNQQAETPHPHPTLPSSVPFHFNRSWTEVWRRSEKKFPQHPLCGNQRCANAQIWFSARETWFSFRGRGEAGRSTRASAVGDPFYFRLINLRDTVTWGDGSVPLGNSVRLRSNFSSTPCGSEDGW